VWWVPAFEEDEVSLTVKEIENDVPF